MPRLRIGVERHVVLDLVDEVHIATPANLRELLHRTRTHVAGIAETAAHSAAGIAGAVVRPAAAHMIPAVPPDDRRAVAAAALASMAVRSAVARRRAAAAATAALAMVAVRWWARHPRSNTF